MFLPVLSQVPMVGKFGEEPVELLLGMLDQLLTQLDLLLSDSSTQLELMCGILLPILPTLEVILGILLL